MKVSEVFESKHFARAVEQTIEGLYGAQGAEGAELATLAIEEDENKREALVITPLGLLTARLDLEGFHADTSGMRPLLIDVTPWAETKPIQLSAMVYPAANGDYAQPLWKLDGIELRKITVRRDPTQLADFGREYLMQRAASSR